MQQNTSHIQDKSSQIQNKPSHFYDKPSLIEKKSCQVLTIPVIYRSNHVIFSNPRQSQGLLFKHCCNLFIHSLTNSSFSLQSFLAPPCPKGEGQLFQLQVEVILNPKSNHIIDPKVMGFYVKYSHIQDIFIHIQNKLIHIQWKTIHIQEKSRRIQNTSSILRSNHNILRTNAVIFS